MKSQMKLRIVAGFSVLVLVLTVALSFALAFRSPAQESQIEGWKKGKGWGWILGQR